MNPLSALKYIRENKGKSLALGIMLFLSTAAFALGNLVSSDEYTWEGCFDLSDKCMYISARGSDEDGKDMDSFLEKIKSDKDLKLKPVGSRVGGISWKTPMGFEMGSSSFVFASKEAFLTMAKHMGIKGDLSKVKDNKSLIISRRLADNLGIKLGDEVDSSMDGVSIRVPMTVDAVLPEDFYSIFYILENDNPYDYYVYSDTLEGDALRSRVVSYKGDLNVYANPDSDRVEIGRSMSGFRIVFIAITAIVGIVLAITANTVITGQFISRTYEFGVYRAIGIGKGRIRLKIMSEILLLDIISVAAGAGVIFLTEYLLNSVVMLPAGKYLVYFSGLGAAGFAGCNLLIIVPMILLKSRQMLKADVTAF